MGRRIIFLAAKNTAQPNLFASPILLYKQLWPAKLLKTILAQLILVLAKWASQYMAQPNMGDPNNMSLRSKLIIVGPAIVA